MPLFLSVTGIAGRYPPESLADSIPACSMMDGGRGSFCSAPLGDMVNGLSCEQAGHDRPGYRADIETAIIAVTLLYVPAVIMLFLVISNGMVGKDAGAFIQGFHSVFGGVHGGPLGVYTKTATVVQGNGHRSGSGIAD